MSKTLKIGIFGANRGSHYFDIIMANNGEIVAVCDKKEKLVNAAVAKLGGTAKGFTDFEEFIKEPMDCIFLANYFHEHAKYAIRCLEMGINVISECTANSTMAEGVALCRAAEKSNAIYMIAENYPFMLFNQEMKRVCDSGSLGKIMFAEGEYNHPGSPYYKKEPGVKYTISLKDSLEHWRNHLPATYYVTHSLAPLMAATGAFPKKVTAMPIFMPLPEDCDNPKAVGDGTAIIMTQNDDGSVFRVTGCATFGAREDSYRICGKKGQIENVRGSDGMVMQQYNGWDRPEGWDTNCKYYKPELIDDDKELIEKSGHGGGDFFVFREFFRCVREGKPHQFDVYFATAMASVAILGHRSVLAGGVTFDVPDFRLEEDKKKWENDYSTPFFYSEGYFDDVTAPNIPSCSRPEYRPSKQQLENYLNWLEMYNNGELDEF
ncbi:MAG: Gfo/Idh/MocA family oxidoreductase [Ruminococcaceae bacterium]|nr:Gfo/Idh/MocA family oxidoreductase [Oscillospiraceae bacterium]